MFSFLKKKKNLSASVDHHDVETSTRNVSNHPTHVGRPAPVSEHFAYPFLDESGLSYEAVKRVRMLKEEIARLEGYCHDR